MTPFIPFFIIALATFLGVGLYVRIAHGAGIHDIPNERSAHTQPTVRGGGLVFAGVISIAWLFFGVLGFERSGFFATALAVAGLLLAAWIGWCDDRQSVPARKRLAFHFVSAAITTSAALWFTEAGDAILWFPLLVLLNTGFLNFFNFMDGINGIAALQALIGGVAFMLLVPGAPTGALGLSLVAACLGFLPWNFPRARVFMGDVGSGFLGLALGYLGTLLFLAGLEHPEGFAQGEIWNYACALSPFLADPIVTLAGRWRRGEKLMSAHSDHAYQHLARRWGSHFPVTLFYGALALVAFAISVKVGRSSYGALSFIGAFLAQALIFLVFGAGKEKYQIKTNG